MDSQDDLTEAQLKIKYQTSAQKLLNNEITPEQFADEQTEIFLKLASLADHDGLIANFLNNNGLTNSLTGQLSLIKRIKYPACLLALDIDYLKKFNDKLGHVAGDKLIKIYAQVMEQHIRISDLKGRVGGDEFVVFLIGADLAGAKLVAERIRADIIKTVKEAFPNIDWDQTISIGITQVLESDGAKSLRERADQALYEAKKDRNKVSVK